MDSVTWLSSSSWNTSSVALERMLRNKSQRGKGTGKGRKKKKRKGGEGGSREGGE